MRIQTTITLLTAATLALTSMSAFAQGGHGQGGARPMERAQIERGQKDFDRDRMRDRDRITSPAHDRDRVRDQDRTHAPEQAPFGQKAGKGGNGDGIYGYGLMSEEERNQYREQLRLTESDPKARAELMAQHEEEMQKRARAQGVNPDKPPVTEEAE